MYSQSFYRLQSTYKGRMLPVSILPSPGLLYWWQHRFESLFLRFWNSIFAVFFLSRDLTLSAHHEIWPCMKFAFLLFSPISKLLY